MRKGAATDRMPTVSVIVPSRDRPESLRRALVTILDQSSPPNEVVVADDGSTRPVPSGGPVFGDARVRVVRGSGRPGGVSAARNRALAAATADWVAFCDDDDLWVPDKLERQLAAAREARARWCLCDAVVVDAGWRIVEQHRCDPAELGARLARSNPVPGGGSGAIVERALLEELGGFDPAFAMFADWELWLRLHGRARCASSGATGVVYRLHDGQMSADLARVAGELERLVARHPGTFVDGARLPEIDAWVIGRMRRAGRYRDALRRGAGLRTGRARAQLATLAHPAKRAARPWLLPLVARTRDRLGRGVGDAEGRAALERTVRALAERGYPP